MFEIFIFTNGIFLGILLLIQRSGLRRANLFLALFLISLSMELAPGIFEEEEIFLPETSFFTVPLLFLYVQQIIKSAIRKAHLLWLLPGLLVNLFLISLGDTEPEVLVVALITIPFYALNLYLLFNLYKLISQHQESLKDQYTSLETRTLKWVRGLVLIFIIFHVVWLLDDSLLIASFDFPLLASLAELLTLVSVFWVGYYGLNQQASALVAIKEPNKKEASQEAEEREAFDAVLKQIEAHKLYLNQELTLRLLAQQVGVNEKKLSGWINLYTDNNFYHLINRYRVNEFKQQVELPENRNLNLLGIAQNSGFRNKSTFYKVFKELEGTTPSGYQKTHFSESKV